MIEDDIASPLSFFPSLCLFFPVRRQSLPSFFSASPFLLSILQLRRGIQFRGIWRAATPPANRACFFELGERGNRKKKTRARDATRRDFYRESEQKGEREEGKGAKRFFFCGRKGDYAAGLATVCPIDRPIRSLLGIRLRWMIKRGRD